MHRARLAPTNLPIEIVRTFVAIAETGSFTKAGDRLGLGQPAISAQVKKMQTLLGGPVFARVAGGVTLTERGVVILPQARRLLQANDQLLLLAGSGHDARPIRIGLSRWFVEGFLRGFDRTKFGGVHLVCDDSKSIQKGLTEGYLDIGALVSPYAETATLLTSWDEELVWVRGRDFVLSPGSPVPLVHWGGYHIDQRAIEILQARGMTYRVVCECADFLCRTQAVASGIGLAPWPRRYIWDGLVVATESYLPPLPAIKAGIAARAGFDLRGADALLKVLRTLGETPANDVLLRQIA